MKNIFISLIVVIVLFCASSCTDSLNTENENYNQQQYEFESEIVTCGEYSYREFNGEIYLIRYEGEAYDVKIPETINGKDVTVIGASTFYGTTIERISIPRTRKEIRDNPFIRATQLKEILVNEENQYYESEGGILYDEDMSTLIAYPEDREEKVYTIPDTVKTINDSCFGFEANNLERIIFHDKIMELPRKPLYGRQVGKTMQVAPEGSAAEKFIKMASLWTDPEERNYDIIIDPQNIEKQFGDFKYIEVEDGARITEYTNRDKKVEVPALVDGKAVTEIGPNAFWTNGERPGYEEEMMEYLIIQNGVSMIDSDAFLGCGNLKKIDIPASVSRMGRNPFYKCPSLETINVDANNKQYSSVDGVLYNKDKTILYVYPDGKKDVEFIIPETVETIADDILFPQTVERVHVPPTLVQMPNSNVFSANPQIVLIVDKGSTGERYADAFDINIEYI